MTDDPLAGFHRLNEPRYRRTFEEANGVFVAEGPTVLAHLAARAPGLVEEILVEDRRRERIPPGLDGARVHALPSDRIAEIVGFDFHRGVLALCRRPPAVDPASLTGLDSLVVLEGVNDQENLGAIVRAAAALGVGGVLLDPTSADPWYRRTVRVSMGTVVDLPIARASAWPDDLDRLGDFDLIAATLSPSAVDLRTVTRPPRPAVLLGAEGPGLSLAARGRASIEVTIPMRRGVDSLNVGQAAAILFDRLLA